MDYLNFIKCCKLIKKEVPQLWDIFLCCDFKDIKFTTFLLAKVNKLKK